MDCKSDMPAYNDAWDLVSEGLNSWVKPLHRLRFRLLVGISVSLNFRTSPYLIGCRGGISRLIGSFTKYLLSQFQMRSVVLSTDLAFVFITSRESPSMLLFKHCNNWLRWYQRDLNEHGPSVGSVQVKLNEPATPATFAQLKEHFSCVSFHLS